VIDTELAEAIAERVGTQALGEQTAVMLRAEFPELHFTYCFDDDIHGGKPVIQRPGFNLYLVDGREHCLCLTTDAAVATGVVVAEVVDED
jgi:hypothetical protein